MSNETRLAELVSRYEAARQLGQSPAMEEICRDCPELLDELRQRIAGLDSMRAFLGTTQGEKSPVSTVPYSPPGSATPRLPMVAGYEILGVLGRGGMGVVYQARQVRLKRLVALKMILSGVHAGAEQLERFRVEAEAVAQLQHPNIVKIRRLRNHPCPRPPHADH
jgi:serine/threonine protein kinase